MKNYIILIYCTLSILNICQVRAADPEKSYSAENGAIVGLNTGRYNNRPLYIYNTNGFVLTGDQPIMRLVKNQYLYGTFVAGIEREGKTKWLFDCDQVRSMYYPGRMTWDITDKAFAGLKIHLEVVPQANVQGMAILLKADGLQKGDLLRWSFGGAKWFKNQNLSWKLDVMGQPELLSWGLNPEESRNNIVTITDQACLVSLTDSIPDHKLFTVAGNCSFPSKNETGRVFTSNDLTNNKLDILPQLTGSLRLENGKPFYWAFEAFNKGDSLKLINIAHPQQAFIEGMKRTDSFCSRLKINTPDESLNAMAQASVAAVDGTWYPPVFVHGAMQWNNRFPGWRTIFGGTMYGWHDRVRKEAEFYTKSQIKVSDKKEAKADPATLLTEQHENSRYYGIGRIDKDQKFYDMQTQFFDQIVEEYRWTNDPELVRFFRASLELHLQWMKDCFDPDGDGVYESYINTWPSDSQWYNGGGTAEETSYAYRGHLAARDMAKNAGDKSAEAFHNQMLEKIKDGFFKQLWIKEKGHSGSYREQGGHERLHTDPWLYSIFLPIDAGLTSPLQSVESVYYSEWALQNDRKPSGGRQVWTSNWVPAIWSVRELWPGDNYHLALSYFLSGLPGDGYDILRGTFLRTGYSHISPGNFGGIQGGFDFGDCLHPFTRALVSGLFGVRPDYPNNKVIIAPQFPADWDHASIALPDFGVSFSRIGGTYKYETTLTKNADLELCLPVQCRNVSQVKVNGKDVKWENLAGWGRSIVKVIVPSTVRADITIETEGALPYFEPQKFVGNVGDPINLTAEKGLITGFEDPQHILDNVMIKNGCLNGVLSGKNGNHTIVTHTKTGNTLQDRIFRISINDTAAEQKEKDSYCENVPVNARWDKIDISGQTNADITKIYQQHYLSPRPNTVSARLGTDGYSPWTFPHWKSVPPEIKLDNLPNLSRSSDQILTLQGVPFKLPLPEKNVAFTSLWDNYPVKIDFQVNKSGDAVWFLVAGSTNIMQCRIANAVIRLNYGDGQTDSLELVPPVNYWNLSTIDSHATAPGQGSRIDYTSEIDRFCMPAKFPETVQLGENCRAMLLNRKLRKNQILKSITLETLSQEVVVGMMGISVMKN